MVRSCGGGFVAHPFPGVAQGVEQAVGASSIFQCVHFQQLAPAAIQTRILDHRFGIAFGIHASEIPGAVENALNDINWDLSLGGSVAKAAKGAAKGDKLASARELKEQLDHARAELEIAKREGNLAKAGELSYGVIPQLEKQLGEAEKAEDQGMMVEEAVRPEQIAQVVERWTGIPTAKMLEGEREKLLQMETLIGKRVIGQDQAVQAIDEGVRAAKAGLNSPTQPMGVSVRSSASVSFVRFSDTANH